MCCFLQTEKMALTLGTQKALFTLQTEYFLKWQKENMPLKLKTHNVLLEYGTWITEHVTYITNREDVLQESDHKALPNIFTAERTAKLLLHGERDVWGDEGLRNNTTAIFTCTANTDRQCLLIHTAMFPTHNVSYRAIHRQHFQTRKKCLYLCIDLFAQLHRI